MSSTGATAGHPLPRAADRTADPDALVRMLDHLPSMVGQWDAEARNVFANAEYSSWFGRAPADIRGRHMAELLGEAVWELNRPYVEGVLASGEPQHFERSLLDVHGQRRYVQVTYVPNVVDGLTTGFFVMVTDVTGRVRSEKALQESVRQIALLEERQRIAADLHDLVIQRLFAAGLDLGVAARENPDASGRIHSAAVGVDEGIRELRRAIHSLQELMSPTQVPASIEKLLTNATRTLGFPPSVTYTGSLAGVPAGVVTELLAVLNEALSNVTRHAAASAVHVTLASAPDHLVLQVADDGRGLFQPERSSGLTNMRARAHKLGGTFVCRDNEPRGTVVEWSVPVTPVR